VDRQGIAVDPILIKQASLELLRTGKTIGQASGFFYTTTDRVFLITNRHVVIDEQRGYEPDEVRFSFHADAENFSKIGYAAIGLYSKGAPVWKEFDDKSVDAAAIPITFTEIRQLIHFSYSPKDLPPDDLILPPGEDLLVIGYPLGFYDDKHVLPVIRKAGLASAYPVPFKGRPFFLVDARLHPGTSGSPVILKPTSIIYKRGGTSLSAGMQTYLLGIHSHTWPVRRGEEPLGLSAVWFASLVEELTQN